jgi:hypothetical protein
MYFIEDNFGNRVGENLDCASIGYDNLRFGSWLPKFRWNLLRLFQGQKKQVFCSETVEITHYTTLDIFSIIILNFRTVTDYRKYLIMFMFF